MSILPWDRPDGFGYFRMLAYVFTIIGVAQMLRSQIATGAVFISAAALLFILNTFLKHYR